MVDRALRPVKARLFAPLAYLARAVPPDALTAAGLVVGLAAAWAAALGRFDLALAGWLANRVLDGLDGDVARLTGRAGARGAYLDLMADLVVYAAVPLGLAAGVAAGGWADPVAVWAAAAAAPAAFYVNLGSFSLLSSALALQEEGRRARARTAAPTIHLPAGLIEGAETVVALAVALAFPALAPWTLATVAVLTLLTAAQRVWWGARRLAAAADLDVGAT
jgi:phosphatidylserine synthase